MRNDQHVSLDPVDLAQTDLVYLAGS